MQRNWLYLLLAAGGAWLLTEGSGRPLQAEEPADETVIRSRATNFFDKAALLKPRQDPETLEPLFICEVLARKSLFFAATVTKAGGDWVFDTTAPAVYTNSAPVSIQGKLHPRHVFLWFIPGPAPDTLDARGIAITLDSGGNPAVWETFSSRTPTPVLYISKSLETKALLHFGKPLTNRLFSAEVPLAGEGGAIVARVLDDGPVPMGPIVHISAADAEVSAVTCRCMPSQAKELVSTSTYALLPLELLSGGPDFAGAAGPRLAAFIKGEPSISRLLQLPPGF